MKYFTRREKYTLIFLGACLLAGGIAGEMRKTGLIGSGAEDRAAMRAEEKLQAGLIEYRKRKKIQAESAFIDSDNLIDINSATAIELEAVKGIGPKLAKKIVDYRQKNRYFRTVQELTNIPGIGPGMLSKWEAQLIAGVNIQVNEDKSSE